MNGTPESPNVGAVEPGRSPKTPQGRKLVQGRLPFAIINKTSSESVGEEDIKPKDEEEARVPASKKTKSKVPGLPKSVECINIASESSSSPVPIEAKAENAADEDQDDDLDGSFSSKDSREVLASPALKKMTPKQMEREKKKEEKRKEREEKEKKKAEEKAEKERQKREKQEEKKRKEEEKEAEKKRKEEERKRKEEEKEAEKRRKEEDKKRREEEKEAERRKEEEKEKRKKERISQAFTSFFTQKKVSISKTEGETLPVDSASLAFVPFQVKDNMKLAPIIRTNFDEQRKKQLDETVASQSTAPKSELFVEQLKKHKGRKSGATWPLTKDNEIEIIDEDEAPANEDDIVMTSAPMTSSRMRAKLLQFSENRRPAYWGTWRKQSRAVGPRTPFGKDETIFDYDLDSDDEWEEVEPGESLTDSEGEGEDKEPADDYEVDNEFLVPHGYLSEEEGDSEEDERPVSPSTAKERLKMKEEQFERELKEKTCQIKPSLIGCCWVSESGCETQLLKVLNRYAAVVLVPTPINLTGNDAVCDAGDSPMTAEDPTRSEKMARRTINDSDIPTLIRLLHGNTYSKLVIIKEFQLYIERNRTEDRNVPSKSKIVAKIAEIASWTKCTEAGPMNGRTCWLVHADVLERYNMSDLSAVNAWEFLTETKKRGRKIDESKVGEDGDETPPSKTARMSLMKKFVHPQPQPSTPNEASAKVDSPLPLETDQGSSVVDETPRESPKLKATPKAKKRIALVSLSTSASKKPRNDSVATPLTSFIRKMGANKSETKSSDTETSMKKDDVVDSANLD